MAKKSRSERKAETARQMSSAPRTLRPAPTTPPVDDEPNGATAATKAVVATTATVATVGAARAASRSTLSPRQQAARQSSQLRAQVDNTGARLSPSDISREDTYVRHDLRNVVILASILLVTLVVLAFVLPRALG
ncbi:MAG: hypothetical protein U0641_15240 [Anaerolineae bacterium]